MTEDAGAAVALRGQLIVARSASRSSLEILDGRGAEPVRLTDTGDWASITGIGGVVARGLQRIIRGIPAGRVKLSIGQRDDALAQIHGLGVAMWSRLLGGYRSTNPLLGPGTLDRALLSLELVCPNDLILPVELLPVLEPLDQRLTSSDPSLHRAATLVGFGAQAQRPVVLGRSPVTADLDVSGLSFYWDARLSGARREWKQLSKTCAGRTVGPSPDHRRTTRTELARRLVDAPRRDGCATPPAVEHISCHHVRGGAGEASSGAVWLRPKGWLARGVPLTADDLARHSLGRPPKGGLVFLNACGTHPASPRAVSSLVRELYQCGRTSIVATWCDVPDLTAAQMGEYFYESLYAGATVGEALREARLQLLLKLNNPLGLLYTIYGDAGYRLVRRSP